jgi:GMP synthase-like glutamine amidotransferase
MKPIIIVQNWGAEGPGLIEDHLISQTLPHRIIKNYEYEPLPKAEDTEAVIVLGFPHAVNHYLKYDQMKALWAFMAAVMRRSAPLLGMCYGGQMLAKILGAEVTRNPVKEIGRYRIRLTEAGKSDPLFAGFESEFDVFQWHGDPCKIPRGADSLAEGETCQHQAFRKGRSVGVQFHLDPRPEEVPLWCDEYAEELASEGKTKDQIVSDYEAHVDAYRTRCYQLVDNFLRG